MQFDMCKRKTKRSESVRAAAIDLIPTLRKRSPWHVIEIALVLWSQVTSLLSALQWVNHRYLDANAAFPQSTMRQRFAETMRTGLNTRKGFL